MAKAKSKNASKSKGAKATKKGSKKSAAKKSAAPFDGTHLENAGFTKATGGGATTYTKGGKRVEVSSIPGEKGSVEHVKYFDEAHASYPNPVVHASEGAQPSKEFLTDFTK
jgi:hypothetical protein